MTVVASSPSAVLRFHERESDGVRLVQVPGIMPPRWRYGYDPYEVLRRLQWLSGKTFDIVHALECRPVVIYPALAAKRRGARLVIDWYDWFGRGGSVEQRSNPIMRTLLRPIETYYEEAFRTRADATIVVNSVLEARACALGVRPETLLRLPHGSDPEGIRPLDRDQARAKLGLPLSASLVGYVGVLFTEDAVLLVKAFERVRAVQPSARLVLIGNPKTDVPKKEGMIRTGFVSYQDLNRYMAACDVLCLPCSDTLANRGRFPSKIADYLAVGRASAVACADGDLATLMRETNAGLVCEPTPSHLAECILQLLDDVSLRTRLGRNARHAAETCMNWATLAEQVEELYQRLLGR